MIEGHLRAALWAWTAAHTCMHPAGALRLVRGEAQALHKEVAQRTTGRRCTAAKAAGRSSKLSCLISHKKGCCPDGALRLVRGKAQAISSGIALRLPAGYRLLPYGSQSCAA